MKQLIVISPENIIPDEATLIQELIDNGVDRVHIRKPHCNIHDIEILLQSILPDYYRYIVLHDAFSLTQQYRIGGLHLNNRNLTKPHDWKGSISRSCHTIEELKVYKHQCDYLFLSPINNSISKLGYQANFSPQELIQAHQDGIIDKKVIALGGITRENVHRTLDYGFGGIALLGHVWQQCPTTSIKNIIKPIKDIISCYNS